MPLVRLIAMLAVCAIGVSLGLYFFTRDPKYLRFAKLTGKIVLVLALVFFALMIIERVAIL